MSYYDDGDLFLPIRTKINGLADLLKVAETDELIEAGAVTSIPITALTLDLLPSGQKVTVIAKDTGEAHELTLTAAMDDTDEALTVTSYTFLTDLPSGSLIFYDIKYLLNYLFHPPA